MYTQFHGEVHNGKHVDQVLREYFPDYDYKGVFLDVGAFDPIVISNSYHFEMNGWDTYCFEANPTNFQKLIKQRQKVCNVAISDEDKDEVEFNIVTTHDDWTASYSALNLSDEYKKVFGWNDKFKVDKIKVRQRRLDTIMANTEVKNIDIISIDIEGGELNCLRGIDLNKYGVKVICIENGTNSKEYQEYLESKGYTLDKVYAYNQFYII